MIHLPKRQPPRAARAKSFQQYDTFDNMDHDLEDSDPEIIEEEDGGIADIDEENI